MDEAVLVDLSSATLRLALMLVAPALIVGMTVGLMVSLFQTLTSLQEQTLAIVPKLMTVAVTLLLLLPWILGRLREFTRGLFENLADYGPHGF